MQKKYSLNVKILLFSLALLTACDFNINPENQNPNGTEASPSPSASPSIGPNGDITSAAAKNAKANAEIFHEMFTVVLMREFKDRAEFGNWVDTLNQGASLEGVYNGLTHSEEYRQLESSTFKASEKAVKTFREEVNFLQSELPHPTKLGNFGLAPIHLLKRVLCEEALKVVAFKSEQGKEKLASWYSKWAVHMTQRNVDFGIPLRNKADEAFHFQWATEVSQDRIQWEVLNRLHRVLNEANK